MSNKPFRHYRVTVHYVTAVTYRVRANSQEMALELAMDDESRDELNEEELGPIKNCDLSDLSDYADVDEEI